MTRKLVIQGIHDKNEFRLAVDLNNVGGLADTSAGLESGGTTTVMGDAAWSLLAVLVWYWMMWEVG